MERKNTILLTVIAIATLLVAVVGATFAYFTASTSTSGTGANTTIQTTKLEGANITFTAEDSKFELLKYPGGIAVYGAKATIAKQQPGTDQNEYQATFNLKIDYTNNTQTDMEWELYMVESQVDNLNAAATTICKFRQEKNAETGETQYWYSDSESTPLAEDKGCTASAITSKLTQLHATKIASGQLTHGKDVEQHITSKSSDPEYKKGDGSLEDRMINTADKQSKYYYLVVKYPNNTEEDQNADAGKTFSVKLSIDGQPASEVYTPAA